MAIENVKDSALTRKTTPVSSDLVRIVSAPGTLPVSQTTTLGNLTKGLDPTNFPPSGTLGQIWTSNGPSTPPSMQAAPAGTVPVSGTSKTAILGGNGAASWAVTEIGQVAAHLLTPKQAAQGVNVTDAASGSSGITVADNAQIDFGTGNFALVWRGALPDWISGAATYLISKAPLDYSKYVILEINAAGNIQLSMNNGTLNSVSASTSVNTFVDKETHEICVVVNRETGAVDGSVVYYVNGSAFGSPVAISFAQAGAGGDIGNTGSLYVSGSPTARYASTTHAALLLNFAPTAAEIKTLYDTQTVPESWKWGSQTPLYASNFSAGADSWTAANGTAAGNIDSIGGEDDWLRLTVDAVNTTHFLERAIAGLTLRKKVKISVKYFIPAGQTVVAGLRIRGIADNISGLAFQGTLDAVTTYTGIGEITGAETGLRIYATTAGNALTLQDAGGDDVIYVKVVIVNLAGATAALLPEGIQPTGQWLGDANNLHGTLPASGASILRRMDFGRYIHSTAITGDTTWTSVVPAGFELERIVFENSTANAVTINLGTSAAGTQVINGGAIAASTFTTLLANKTFSRTANQTLYLSSADWNSASLVATLFFRRIN